MGLRYEVWSLPWDSGGFVKRFFWLPVIPGSGSGTINFLTTQGDGSVDIPLDKLTDMGKDLSEIISETTSSLIRVFDCKPDGTNTIIDEWVCERPPREHDNEKVVTISGPKLKAKIFDGQTLPSFDAPKNPSTEPDHIWGGENILSDPGFENAAIQNLTIELKRDGATGGDFTFTVNGDPTPALTWNIGPLAFEAEIELLPDVTDVLVTGTDDGWTIEFHVPFDAIVSWDPDNLTGGGGDPTLETLELGLINPGGSWTRSQNLEARSNTHIHGTYASDGFRLTEDAEPVHSGTYALRINGLSRYAGTQQVITVTPGGRYQASIWVWTSDATEIFKLVMRDRYENWIAETLEPIPVTSSWVRYDLDFISELPDGTPVDEIIFRFAQTRDHNPGPYYVDDASLNPGAPPSPWGEIINVLMDLKTTEFDWIDRTFTNTVDSTPNAWLRFESITGFFGESYGQFFDKGVDLEYEWDLVAKDVPVGSLTHDLVWYETGGLDSDPPVGIYPNASVTGGDSMKRTPAFTKVRVEGSEGRWVEVEDAIAVANFGPIEEHIRDTSLHSDDSLTARGNAFLAFEEANRTAVQFAMVESDVLPRPLSDFKPGDTVAMALPPQLEKTDKRVQAISYTNTFPTQYQVTGSKVFQGEAAAYSLLWRLWRRFEIPDRGDKEGRSRFGTSSGGMIHVTIASTSEPRLIQDKADYVVPQQNSSSVLQAIFDEINDSDEGGSWSIWMVGVFDLDQDVIAPPGAWIRGLGYTVQVPT